MARGVYEPLPRAVDECFIQLFFYSPDIFNLPGVFLLLDIWVFRAEKKSGQKKKKNRERLVRRSKNMCAKFEGLFPKNCVDIWNFERNTCAICSYYVVLRFSMESTLDVADIGITLPDLRFFFFCMKYYTDMPWSTCSRLVHKKKFSYRNAWSLLTFLKACGRWGHCLLYTSPSPRD